jgi:hypothetical protein
MAKLTWDGRHVSEPKFYFVYHPGGVEYFPRSERREAELFARQLANEFGKPIKLHDVNGGEKLFRNAY